VIFLRRERTLSDNLSALPIAVGCRDFQSFIQDSLATLLRRERLLTDNIRALGRHLCRIIYKLLTEEREYEMRPEKGNTKSKVRPRSLIKTQIPKPKISVKETNNKIYQQSA